MPSPVENNYLFSISELIQFLDNYTQSNAFFSKEAVAIAVKSRFALLRSRSVYYNDYLAIRFSEASGSSFSNTILGLSTLRNYDERPFFVCVIRSRSIELLLANSTFLKKVSHSSQQLRVDNIRGSFLGHDIVREYEGIPNTPQNFERLFLIHKEFSWEENLARLVEATNNIVPSGSRYSPTLQERNNIIASVEIAHMLSSSSEYLSLGETLGQLVEENRSTILDIGNIENINVRGNRIEQTITNAANFHGVEDLSYTLSVGSRVLIDIKTKVLTLASSPKGYNIDKVLRSLGTGNTAEVLKVRLRNEKRGTKCSILSSYNKKQRPMLDTFPKIVKSILQRLCAHDYPVLNSRLFFEIWLTFVLDKGLTSMRDLFYRLNKTGIKVDISTFSKACKTRQDQHFCRIYAELMEQLKRKNAAEAQMLFPIDSTVVTLTSKLFWMQGYHQVKLMNGLNLAQGNLSECLIHFGQGHDARFADLVTGMIPENGIGIMDRGFAGWEFLDQLSQTKTLFVVRIKNTMKTELDHQRYRVVWFCDLESKTEFRLATNVEQMTNEEIAEVYRHRWQIEVLWKFLKMHLKLDKLITKSMNGVTIQIYMVLIVYLILQLIEVSAFYGCQLLDKLRYLQLELSRRCSIVHWSYDLPETLVGVS